MYDENHNFQKYDLSASLKPKGMSSFLCKSSRETLRPTLGPRGHLSPVWAEDRPFWAGE